MNDNLIIPVSVEVQIDQFSSSLRAIDFANKDQSIAVYRNIIRANIHDVFDVVYPLLVNELGYEKIREIVNAFLLSHQACEAEFHKLATELISFLQQSDFLDISLSSLAEYEWLLYHIETLETPVIFEKQYCFNDYSNMLLRLNPTLKTIKLPFQIQEGIVISDHVGEFIYGLFKNAQDEILRKRLFAFDLLMLHLIVDKNITLITDLESLIPEENKKYLQPWIIKNIAEEFITLNDAT